MSGTPAKSSNYRTLIDLGCDPSQAYVLDQFADAPHLLEHYPVGTNICTGITYPNIIKVVGWGEFTIDSPKGGKLNIHMKGLGPPPATWGGTATVAGAGTTVGGSGVSIAPSGGYTPSTLVAKDYVDEKIASLTEAINTMAKSLEVLHEENDTLRARVFEMEARLEKCEGKLATMAPPVSGGYMFPSPVVSSVSYPPDYEEDLTPIKREGARIVSTLKY